MLLISVFYLFFFKSPYMSIEQSPFALKIIIPHVIDLYLCLMHEKYSTYFNCIQLITAYKIKFNGKLVFNFLWLLGPTLCFTCFV